MFHIVDAALSYERELIVCSFLQNFSMGKGSSLQIICNAHTAFLHFRAEFNCAPSLDGKLRATRKHGTFAWVTGAVLYKSFCLKLIFLNNILS